MRFELNTRGQRDRWLVPSLAVGNNQHGNSSAIIPCASYWNFPVLFLSGYRPIVPGWALVVAFGATKISSISCKARKSGHRSAWRAERLSADPGL